MNKKCVMLLYLPMDTYAMDMGYHFIPFFFFLLTIIGSLAS